MAWKLNSSFVLGCKICVALTDVQIELELITTNETKFKQQVGYHKTYHSPGVFIALHYIINVHV